MCVGVGVFRYAKGYREQYYGGQVSAWWAALMNNPNITPTKVLYVWTFTMTHLPATTPYNMSICFVSFTVPLCKGENVDGVICIPKR